MNSEPLAVSVKCRGNDECLFDGKDIFIDIVISNNEQSTVGFPLEYLKHKGPIIKLIDTRSKAETFLPTHIADWDLKEDFTQIKQGGSVSIEWVITAGELSKFGSDVDLYAEVTIMAEILVNGKKLEFRGSNTRRFLSKK